jgi:tetratricopeptide (TPR) repeat protein
VTDDQRSIMNSNEAIKSALDNFEYGKLELTEFICREILKENPVNATNSLHLLGVICYHLNNHASAIQYFDTSLRLNPDNFEVSYNLGIVLQEKGSHLSSGLTINNFLKFTRNSI